MQIVLENNKIQLDSYREHKKNTVYIISGTKDSITFRFNNGLYKTCKVAETSVNGVQMTPDNIDELLAPIFENKTSDNSQSGSGSLPTQPDQAYTQSEYIDPLEFPTPTRAGHITEFYKDNTLYQAYQWNGWDWVMLGAEPDLVYVENAMYPNQFGDNVAFKSKVDNITKLTFNANSPDRTYINASKIIASNTNHVIGVINITPEISDKEIKISDLKATEFSLYMDNTDIKDNCILKNISGRQLNFNLASKNAFLDKIAADGMNQIYTSSPNTTITNSSFNYYSISLENLPDSEDININVSNNYNQNTAYPPDLLINSDYQKKQTIKNLTVKDNQGIRKINIESVNYIDSVDVSFDKSLESVSLSQVNFNQAAFNNLVNALVETPVNNEILKDFYLSNVTPALSQEQKDALTAAGWSVG